MTDRCPATTTDRGYPTRCVLAPGHSTDHDDGVVEWWTDNLPPAQPPSAPSPPPWSPPVADAPLVTREEAEVAQLRAEVRRLRSLLDERQERVAALEALLEGRG